MDDRSLIQLLFKRDESVLKEISKQYSQLYNGIIRKILSDDCDVEECGNDVLLAVWNTIPPNCPNSLPAYICKIARNISVDRFRYNTREKRNAGYTVMLSELNYCLPAKNSKYNGQENSDIIKSVLSEFLRNLDPETEILFIRRYIYLESVSELSLRFNIEENHISVKLYRARKKLKKVLEREGVKV